MRPCCWRAVAAWSGVCVPPHGAAKARKGMWRAPEGPRSLFPACREGSRPPAQLPEGPQMPFFALCEAPEGPQMPQNGFGRVPEGVLRHVEGFARRPGSSRGCLSVVLLKREACGEARGVLDTARCVCVCTYTRCCRDSVYPECHFDGVVILMTRFRRSFCCWSVVTLSTAVACQNGLPKRQSPTLVLLLSTASFAWQAAGGLSAARTATAAGGWSVAVCHRSHRRGRSVRVTAIAASAPAHPPSLALRLEIAWGVRARNLQGGCRLLGSPPLHLLARVVVGAVHGVIRASGLGHLRRLVHPRHGGQSMARRLGHLRPPRAAVPSL